MAKATQELKYKRLKVGHACYICRSKKIKCDGLRPCMQCKARGRNCQSSANPGSVDISAQPEQATSLPTASSDEGEDSICSSTFESDDDSILFSRAKKQDEDDLNSPQFNESWTSSTIYTASENLKQDKCIVSSPFSEFPKFGSFVRWREEPPLPSKYTYPIEMPSNEIQMHLIDLYFKSRYKITPMIPKRLFYEQLRVKGPLITPLLLNAMYCVVSNYSTLPDIPKPSVFYNRAKRLIDDFLDTPRVTTVAALCLLSLYEPLPTKTKGITDQHCRSWMFSGMAFRMCLELGLNVDTPSSRADMGPDGIEFCRRVFWSCYCLDKMQSAEWERLWSIPSSLVKTAFPQVIPGDDEEEQYIVKAYEQKIRLAIISEEGLQIRASFSIRDDILDAKFHDQLEYYRQKILKWRDELDSPEQWGLAPCYSIEQILNEPKQSSIMSYLHVVFYFMLTETLFCLPNNQNGDSLQQRIYASQLTKSVEILCDNPSMVIRYEFLAHVTIAAIRVHARYMNDPDTVIAQQSYGFFNRCVQILRKFQKYAIIPECSAVLTHLPVICKKLSEPSNLDSYPGTNDAPNFTQVLSQQPYDITSNGIHPPAGHPQQEPMRDGSHVDPYHNDSAGYQNTNMASSYNSLTAFGSTFGVDFANRRQLWEYALQDVNNDPQNDIQSSANSPVASIASSTQNYTQQQGYQGDWNQSPETSSFVWPVTSAQEKTLSPPYKSLSLSYDNQHATKYTTPSVQHIQPQWSISPTHSSPPSPQNYMQQQQYSMPSSTSDNMNTILSYSSTHNDPALYMNSHYQISTQQQQQQHVSYTCYPN